MKKIFYFAFEQAKNTQLEQLVYYKRIIVFTIYCQGTVRFALNYTILQNN